MLIKTFTLRMDRETMEFDDTVLSRFVAEHDVMSTKTQFFFFEEEPMWSIMITYKNKYRPSSLVQEGIRSKRYGLDTRPVENPPKPKLSDKEIEVYEALRLWRNQTARENGHPPANLLNNKQLRAIVALNPRSISQLTKVFGVGKYKSTTYGREILEVLSVLNEHGVSTHGPVGVSVESHGTPVENSTGTPRARTGIQNDEVENEE